MTHSNKRLNCIETSHQQYILNQTATKCNQHFNVNVLKKKSIQRERERNRNLIHWFIHFPQPGQARPKPRTQSRSPTLVARSQLLLPF